MRTAAPLFFVLGRLFFYALLSVFKKGMEVFENTNHHFSLQKIDSHHLSYFLVNIQN